MKASKNASRPRSDNTSKRASLSNEPKIRVGVESMDIFFSRVRANARKLDRDERLAPGLTLSFEDPADFLEVMTPARVRLLQEIDHRAIPLFALAAVPRSFSRQKGCYLARKQTSREDSQSVEPRTRCADGG
jgi:hypothetical protein